MTAGRFIVLEGGDGAGKTTVLAALAEALTQAGHSVLMTREPGGTAEGLALRSLLLARTHTEWDPRAELLLMTAARVQHVQRVIAPALAAGRTVLCDRFVGSSLAYQGSGRGLDPALILRLHRELVGDLWPDQTLLLDLDPALGLARSRGRLARDASMDEGRFEALDAAFHQRVRAAYLELAQARGWSVIDAGQALADVVSAAVGVVGCRAALG